MSNHSSSPNPSASSVESVTASTLRRLLNEIQGFTDPESDSEALSASQSHASSFTSDWSNDSPHSSHSIILRNLGASQNSQNPQGAIILTGAELQTLAANLGDELAERNSEDNGFPDSDSVSWDNPMSRSVSNLSLNEDTHEASELAEVNAAIGNQEFTEARIQLAAINISDKPEAYKLRYYILSARAYEGLGFHEQAEQAYTNASNSIRNIMGSFSSRASEVAESERAESPKAEEEIEEIQASLTQALERTFETRQVSHPRGHRP